MKRAIYFPILASVLLVLQGCNKYKPEVNEENCAIPIKDTREKFKNDDKWRAFNSECNRLSARRYTEKAEKALQESIAKEKALRESRQKESGYKDPSVE